MSVLLLGFEFFCGVRIYSSGYAVFNLEEILALGPEYYPCWNAVDVGWG